MLNKYWEMQDQMNALPKPMPGDVIICQGIKATIKNILYYDRYVQMNEAEEFGIYYDIEFIDTNGKYRHWKSYFDGGKIEFKH